MLTLHVQLYLFFRRQLHLAGGGGRARADGARTRNSWFDRHEDAVDGAARVSVAVFLSSTLLLLVAIVVVKNWSYSGTCTYLSVWPRPTECKGNGVAGVRARLISAALDAETAGRRLHGSSGPKKIAIMALRPPPPPVAGAASAASPALVFAGRTTFASV